jgi:hypothetical protein
MDVILLMFGVKLEIIERIADVLTSTLARCNLDVFSVSNLINV